MTIEDVADMFNTVRNLVAHEGIYWMFVFPENNDECIINVLPGKQTSHLSAYTMGGENLEEYTYGYHSHEISYINQLINQVDDYLKD